MNLIWSLLSIIKPKGKQAFIKSLSKNASILDVGCGNDSPKKTKTFRPDLYYVGIDVGLYFQSSDPAKYADELYIVKEIEFDGTLVRQIGRHNAVICSHTLEHCAYPISTLIQLCEALKQYGTLYVSFPCEESVYFPSRDGCLNFFDDGTHRSMLPFSEIKRTLELMDMEIVFMAKEYKPLIPRIIGGILEPLSFLLGRIIPVFTWAFYGFETVIIARKK